MDRESEHILLICVCMFIWYYYEFLDIGIDYLLEDVEISLIFKRSNSMYK